MPIGMRIRDLTGPLMGTERTLPVADAQQRIAAGVAVPVADPVPTPRATPAPRTRATRRGAA